MSQLFPDLVVPLLVAAGTVMVVTIGYHLLRRLGHRSGLARDLVRQAYRPSQLLTGLLALWLALRAVGDGDWRPVALHVLLLGGIGAGGWLAAALLNVLTDGALRRLQQDDRDPLEARRIRTRVEIAHRVTVAAVSVLAIGVMLVTFDEVRTIGVSLLASAGLVGVVAALAAQSMLSNLIAGLQVAFSDALRLDDVVVVEGEWGWVEEITLRHVVVKIWDERRLILPTSYFTTTPFENWTKSGRTLLGTVELDVDWAVPLAELRGQLQQVLEDSELWDRREGSVQVTDATGTAVRVRVLVSARDSSAQWQLRCLVRERLVEWLQQRYPAALPRVRAELEPPGRPEPGRPAVPGQRPGGTGGE